MIIQKHLIFDSSVSFEKWQTENAGKIDPSLFVASPILLVTKQRRNFDSTFETSHGYGIYVSFNQEIQAQ
jgi:hypothetical protein